MLPSIRILLVRIGREGYNWNQLILHASIYLRKQSLEILICKMIMMQAESYMLRNMKKISCFRLREDFRG